jgi:hypothetical protein
MFVLIETCCPSSRVRPSVIVQEDNTGTKHPAPLVLNGPLQFLQCFTVTLSLLYHVCAVASRNIRFASCGTSGKLTLWTCYVFSIWGDPLHVLHAVVRLPGTMSP